MVKFSILKGVDERSQLDINGGDLVLLITPYKRADGEHLFLGEFEGVVHNPKSKRKNPSIILNPVYYLMPTISFKGVDIPLIASNPKRGELDGHDRHHFHLYQNSIVEVGKERIIKTLESRRLYRGYVDIVAKLSQA